MDDGSVARQLKLWVGDRIEWEILPCATRNEAVQLISGMLEEALAYEDSPLESEEEEDG